MIFFWVIRDGTEAKALDRLGIPLNVMVSAGHFYRNRFTIRIPRPKNTVCLFIDSGAQQFSRFPSYPYSTKTYYLWCISQKANLCASLDVPLDLAIPLWKWNYRDCLKVTVENAVEIVECYEKWEKEPKPIPLLVIQGWEIEWFEECMDLYDEFGLLKKWAFWGVGSVCMMRSPKKVYEVCKTIRRRLGTDKWIHAFGVSVKDMKLLSRKEQIDAIDSAIWRPIKVIRGKYTKLVPPIVREFKDGKLVESDKRAYFDFPSKEDFLFYNAAEWFKFLKHYGIEIVDSVDTAMWCAKRGRHASQWKQFKIMGPVSRTFKDGKFTEIRNSKELPFKPWSEDHLAHDASEFLKFLIYYGIVN